MGEERCSSGRFALDWQQCEHGYSPWRFPIWDLPALCHHCSKNWMKWTFSSRIGLLWAISEHFPLLGSYSVLCARLIYFSYWHQSQSWSRWSDECDIEILQSICMSPGSDWACLHPSKSHTARWSSADAAAVPCTFGERSAMRWS